MAENNSFFSSISWRSAHSGVHAYLAARLSKPGADRAFFAPGIRVLGSLMAILLVVVMLAGCSAKAADGDANALMAKTQDIALAYQANGDVVQAQADLAQLDVANPDQWLLMTAETAIAGNDSNLSADGALALAKLSHDLGLRSTSVDAFVRQNSLAPASSPAQPQVETVAAVSAPDTQASAPAVAPVDAPVVAIAPTDAPTATPDAPTATPAPTDTSASVNPQASPQSTMNVRGGPGTEYDVVASIQEGTSVPILAKNPAGDWWQVQLDNGGTGWLYGPLVNASGDTSAVVVAANIPTPPPTAVPAPTAVPQPTAAPAPSGPDFRVVSRELWDVVRNGGHLSGTSVSCGEKRELHVIVKDAGGNILNGVAVQAMYGNQEIYVTGSQGKGEGQVEFVLGSGQGVFVLRDADGREVTSDRVEGMVTSASDISDDLLIGGNFCADAASCNAFRQQFGCHGHYSWTVVFQRAY